MPSLNTFVERWQEAIREAEAREAGQRAMEEEAARRLREELTRRMTETREAVQASRAALQYQVTDIPAQPEPSVPTLQPITLAARGLERGIRREVEERGLSDHGGEPVPGRYNISEGCRCPNCMSLARESVQQRIQVDGFGLPDDQSLDSRMVRMSQVYNTGGCSVLEMQMISNEYTRLSRWRNSVGGSYPYNLIPYGEVLPGEVTRAAPVRAGRRNYPTARIWVGKDNIKRPVKDMSDPYLKKLLQRLWAGAEQKILANIHGSGRVEMDPEQWEEFANNECSVSNKRIYLEETCPTFKVMVRHAEKRGIVWLEEDEQEEMLKKVNPSDDEAYLTTDSDSINFVNIFADADGIYDRVVRMSDLSTEA